LLLALYLIAWRNATGRDVKEFLKYNTLSNCADDHVLSIDRNPFGWSFDVAIKEFKRMGITLKREVNSDKLLDMEFLAKKIVKNDFKERQTLVNFGITPPRFLTCHNKERLVGKITALNPKFKTGQRIVRYKSYMYLCAHHKDVYDSLVVAIARLRPEQGVKRLKIPTYAEVMRRWYTKGMHTPEPDGFNVWNEEIEDEVSNVMVFSDVGLFSKIGQLLESIPEVFHPKFYESGLMRHVHKIFQNRFCWPYELIALRNQHARNTTSLWRLVSLTEYKFLSTIELANANSGMSAMELYTAHWLYFMLMSVMNKWDVTAELPGWVRWIDLKIVTLNFILDAKVPEVVEIVEFNIIRNLVIFLLSFIRLPFDLAVLPRFELPTIGRFIAVSLQKTWQALQPSGRADYTNLLNMINIHPLGMHFIVVAKTGTGKSTQMISSLQRLTGKRVIVIEPRQLLVQTIVDYMKSINPSTKIGGSTSGMTPMMDDVIVYSTFQSLLLRANLQDVNAIYVLDEAHIDEPIYKLAIGWLEQYTGTTVIYTTATPTNELYQAVGRVVEIDLGSVNVFRKVIINEKVKNFNQYIKRAADICVSAHPNDKILVFLPTVVHIMRFEQLVGEKVGVVKRGTAFIDPRFRVFAATRVADAGLTLPDVSIVVTSDVDWAVYDNSGLDKPAGSNVASGFVRLTPQIVSQREGRTGRTCDGTVFKITITEIQVLTQENTARDWLSNIGLVAKDHLNLLPQSIRMGMLALISRSSELEETDAYKYLGVAEMEASTDPYGFQGGSRRDETLEGTRRLRRLKSPEGAMITWFTGNNLELSQYDMYSTSDQVEDYYME